MTELKGYKYKEVSLRYVAKNSFILSNEIGELLNRDELVEKCKTILSENGKVYFILQKKEVCGIVLIEHKLYDASDFTSDQFKVLNDKEQDAIPTYELKEIILSEELKNRDKLIMFDVIDQLKTYVALSDVKIRAIIWGEEVLTDKAIDGPTIQYNLLGLPIGLSIGLMLGVALFHNIPLGMCFGVSLGSLYSIVIYAYAKKKKLN